MAQDLVGKITDQDSVHSPLFLAEIDQMQDGKTIATYKTYFDGTYRIKVKPNQSYQIKISFPGRTDTTVTISVDKHNTLYVGTLFISLRKDGLRLTGFILDRAQDIPINDAIIVLKNVMTRKDEKYTTDGNGAYNLKMDYETNYTLRIDKMSPGIMNKYGDTSFNISTIGFNTPLDFRLDIKLGPTNGYTAPRKEYDPKAKPVNRNLKPSLVVIGAKDSARKHDQDSVIAALNLKLNRKDSLIASIDKRISEINKSNTKVLVKGITEEEATKQGLDAEKQTKLIENQKKSQLEKAETDLKARKQAELELQAKLDKENKENETRKEEELKIAAEKELADTRAQAEQDSLLAVAKSKNKEIMARRKHVQDSLLAIENQKAQAMYEEQQAAQKSHQEDSLRLQIVLKENKREQAEQDSMLKEAVARNKEMIAKRKHVLDSLIAVEGQKNQSKSDIRSAERETQIKDSIRIQDVLAEKRRKALAEKGKAEQDSMLRVAESKNKDMLAKRRRVQDSLLVLENQKLQARNEAQKAEKDRLLREATDLADKQAREKRQKEEEIRQQAELTERERQSLELAQMKKARQDKEMAAVKKADEQAALRKSQLETELAAMKKSREEAEAKLLTEKRDKEAAERQAKKESKRVSKELADQSKKQKQDQQASKKQLEEQQRAIARNTEIDAEQRELEAKRSLEEQEKNRLAQELGKLQKDEQSAVTRDQETKRLDYNPAQALKNEKDYTLNTYETNLRNETKRKADSIANIANPKIYANNGTKLIKAKGFVKNGQTEDPISNVSINIRRLNSIVSQEVTSDESGRYDIVVDSGYFYLVSFYKDKYEISKQILDLTAYKKAEYTMVIQYLKERDDFDPNAKMPIVQFVKNSSKLPLDVWSELQSIVKMMKDIPDLRIKLYGLSSLDEDYPMELSVTRARLVADLLLESGIKPSRIRINGIGAYRPRSGCTEGKLCSEEQYKLDRVVMYRVVKE